jgi:hypothetical protein
LRFILADRVDKFLRRHVGAEDMNLESGALQHRDHEVLADVVEVPLNVSGDDHAGWLRPCGRQQWPEGLHGRLHRPPRQQELRDKALLFLEELATSSIAGIMVSAINASGSAPASISSHTVDCASVAFPSTIAS